MSPRNNVGFLRKYRGEIIIGLGSSVLGVVFGKLADSILNAPPLEQVTVGLLVSLAAFILLLSVTIKKNISWPLDRVRRDLHQVLGDRPPTIFDERRHHFPVEKILLIDTLVRHVLPTRISEELGRRKGTNPQVDIFVDSGTTLESFFPILKRYGFGRKIADPIAIKIQIHTNNLSGVDQFGREPSHEISQEQLHLFGGIPMLKYRAVASDETIKQVAAVASKSSDSNGLTVGIVTANWILVGPGYDRIVLCSSEKQHLNFKRAVVEASDILIVVSPLGKLLKLQDIETLNEILEMPNPLYDGIELDKVNGRTRNRENTFLLTTLRSRKDSVLFPHSANLKNPISAARSDFTLETGLARLNYDPPGDAQSQREIEMPHGYLHNHALDALAINFK